MEIKDLLKSGQTTPEQLMKDLQNQIDDAQKEIAAEKKAEQEKKAKADKEEKDLRRVREAFAYATIDYCMELGLIDKDTSEEDIDKICEDVCKSLKSYEKACKDFSPMRDEFEKILHDDFDWEWHSWPDDAIINTFVRSLPF